MLRSFALLVLLAPHASGFPRVTGTISQAPPGAPIRQPAPRAAQGPPQKPGRLTGKILNAVTGEPLARADVMLMPGQAGPERATYSTTTDASGSFVMADIPPGRYRLWGDRTGYVRTELGSRGAGRMGTTINVAEAQEVTGLELRLQPHAVIAGRVTDEHGEPVAHVRVQALTHRYMQSRRRLAPAGMAATNDLGEYRIFGLAPGHYYLNATYTSSGLQWNSIDSTPGPRSDEPEEGYAATYYPGTNDFNGAMLIQAASGKALLNLDFRLLRTRTVRVRGRILNAARGRASVTLVPRDSAFFGFFDRNMTATRGGDGAFEIRGVTPGSYYLIANAFDGNERQSGRAPVDVGNSNVDGVEIALASGMEVRGALRAEAGAQLDTAQVRLFLEPVEFTMFGGSGAGTVKEDGSFVIRNVVPDRYRLRATGGRQNVYVKSVRAGDQEAPDGEFSILPGAAPALDAVVAAANGQVSGTVTAEKQDAVQGATVVLVPEPAKRQQGFAYRTATLDQYGKFNLIGIPPGEYKLFAWDAVEPGQWMDPEFLAGFESKGKALSIGQSTALTADVELLNAEKAGEAAR
jgi:hypothetical protein